MIKQFRKYADWKQAALDRDLVFVGRFKAFDRHSNFFGFFNWPGTQEFNGWLADSVGEMQMPVEQVKMEVSSIRKLPRVWIMRVDSTNIKSCAYDYLNEHLYVQFHTSDTIYRYNEVPFQYWVGMTEAESVGSYFQKSKHLLVDYCTVKFKKKKSKRGS